MLDDDQQNIEDQLKVVYTEGAFKAYNKLRSMTWTEEVINDYGNEIWRLIALAAVSGEAMDRIVRLAL